MAYLVTGASRGYGASLTNTLRSLKHDVHELQRTPGAGFSESVDLDVPLDRWKQCDLCEADEVAQTVHTFQADGVKLDAIIHCAALREPIDADLVTPLDIDRHYTANITAPLMLTLWLLQFGVLKPGAPVFFFLDLRTKLAAELMPYTMTKQSLKRSVEAFASKTDLSRTRILFVIPPDSREVGSDDVVTAGVYKILNNDETAEIRGNVLQLA